MKKKLFSVILTLALLTAVFWPANAFADETQGGLTIAGDALTGDDYEYDALTHTFTIKSSKAMTLSGMTTTEKIYIEATANAQLTLNGVNITSTDCAFDVAPGASVSISLTGSNTLASGGTYAGLRIPATSALTISGTGSLNASSSSGAGIGGNSGEGSGNIEINSGIVTAASSSGAGIGGGDGGAGGTIVINGGTITADSTGGAGIGGGQGGANGSCRINGGSVKASSIAPQVMGSDGTTNVYLTTITLQNVASAREMTAISVTHNSATYAYGISGAYTDTAGKIYVYLPDGAQTTIAEVGGPTTRYYGAVTTATSAATSAGTLYLTSIAIDTTTLPVASVNAEYNQTIAKTYYGEGTLEFSISSGSLPTGLTLNEDTGVISGTPEPGTDTTTYPIEITLSDGSIEDVQPYTLAVNGGLTITTSSLDSATLNAEYTYTVQHSYHGSYEISYEATGLPTGLSIDPSTGEIHGTPATNSASPYSVVITATAATSGETATKTLSLTVANSSSLDITTTSLTPATIGVLYSQQISDTLSGSGVTYTPSGFPAWLSLSSAGLIEGTPPAGAASSYNISVTASAPGYVSDTQSYTLTVNAAPVLDITTSTLAAGTVDTAYGQTINCTYTGSHGSPIYTLNSGSSLPPGLSMSPAGYISGIPTTAGTYTFGVTASEQSPGTLSDSATISLTINPASALVITTDSLAQGEVGKAYSQTITRTYSGAGTVTFGATGLPAGLAINSSTGVISGTPAWDTNLASPFLVTITATDGSATHQKTLSLTIIKKYVITASAGSGGTISPSGTLNVLRYSSQTFTIKANSGYKIASVTVDGVNKGAILSYTFSNIIDPHTISVKFKSTNGGSSSSDDDDDDSFTSTYTQRTLTDTSSGVTVSGSGIHKLATLKVEDIKLMAEGQSAGSDAIRARLADNRYVVVFQKNLSLSHAFTGTLTITIPVDPKYNGATLTVLHDKNCAAETLTATVSNGKAVFTVTSLSPFAAFVDLQSLYTPTPAPTLVPTPEPTPTVVPTPLPTATPAPKGSASSLFLWLLGGIIVLALAVTIFVRLRSR